MIQLFVVFHKFIFDECYKNIPDDILYKYFTFIAVNPSISKSYTQNKYKVINEWELPMYDKNFQERGYNENSAIYHVYANKLHCDYNYIGFFQYDMEFNYNIIDFLQNQTTANTFESPIYFSLETYDFNFCAYRTWNEHNTLNYVIQDYQQFFKVPFMINEQYPLLNCYVIPKDKYEKIMGWITQLYDKIYPACIQPPNRTHFGHIGGIYERIMAFAVGNEHMHSIKMNIKHDNEYKRLSY